MRDFFERLLKTIIVIVILLAVVLYGIPAIEGAIIRYKDSETATSSAKWMKNLNDNLYLSQMSIPGTHDSASQYVELPFFANCQAYSIYDQLTMGYRYLDIRLGVNTDKAGNKSLKLMHGFTSCKTDIWPWASDLDLSNVLADCYKFLDEYPSETILFTVKQEYGDEPVDEFQTLLDSYIQKDSGRWLLTDSIPKLGASRGKLVLLRRYEDKAGLGKNAGISFMWDDQGGRNDSDTPYVKSEKNKAALFVQDHYEYGNAAKWEVFYYGFANPADGSKGEAFVNFLSTKGVLPQGHPFLHASKLNRELIENATFDKLTNYGWIILDFARENLARRIYITNYDLTE